MAELKKTPLYDSHIKLGAKIVEFGGWEMPVYYSNVIKEHLNVRKKAGLFDICHMGEFFIEGKDSFQLIQKIITNDLRKLEDGKAFYSCICNENGGIIDDLFVYMFNPHKFMIVVNASNVEKDFNWFLKHKDSFDVIITDKTNETAKLDLQGPKSEEILSKLTNFNIKSIKRFNFVECNINNIPMIVSKTGYTGEIGFELYFDSSKTVEVWDKILEAGKEFDIKPIGLGARDTLRIEAGYSLYGHELNEEITPFEAGIGFVIKLDKEDFIGKSALIKAKENLKRTIVAFEMLERGIPRQGYDIIKNPTAIQYDVKENEQIATKKDNQIIKENKIGYVTSGTMSPTFNKGLGLALININQSILENEIHINIREKLYKGKIVKKPIYTFNDNKQQEVL